MHTPALPERRLQHRRPTRWGAVSLTFSILALVSSVAGLDAAEAATPVLWYAQPAAKWTEALPVGNGRIGAMVFGGTVDERIQFNEGTLWTGQPHDYVRAGAGEYLARLRELVAQGSIKEAHALAKEHFVGDPARQKAYQPFGDIRLHLDLPSAAVTGYRRELDLDRAVASVSYSVGDVTYRREVFASYPDNALVVRLNASGAGQLSFSVSVDSPHAGSSTETADPQTLVLKGQVQADGLRFESRLHVNAQGGRVVRDGKLLRIEHANSATLVLVAATSFKSFEDISADPAARCMTALSAIAKTEFEALLARHLSDHQRLFRRVTLQLAAGSPELPTDQRLLRVKQGGLAADPDLAALYFQFGRYLLIASSRAGGQPANLQGIWNELLDPPWESKWTTNINLEMNYWPAEVANLGECTVPLFDLIDDLVVSGSRTARSQYGADGWVLHHNTDLWRGTAPVNNIDGVWPTGGAWLCQHLWEHYLFTQDRAFLAKRAYPAMKAASRFFLSTLVKDPKTGYLVTSPSYSPEQGDLTVGPTMDNQIIRALLDHTRQAAEILKTDSALIDQLRTTSAQLPPNLVGKHGQLQEWLEDVDKPNNAHRHMSPLWALYPGNDITPADAAVYAGAKKLLAWRGEGSTGWSYAWRIPLWARVGDGEFAFRQLSQLLGRKTLPNLFDLCGPFQIDGNFGACAGIAEMLLQSHLRTEAGDTRGTPVIDLLPALPAAWAQGSVSGLLARGPFEVAMQWTEGKLAHAEIHGQAGTAVRVRYRDHAADVTIPSSGVVRLDAELR